MTGKGHVAFQSICIVDLKTSKVFPRSSMSLSKVITESCWRPFMICNNLGDIKTSHWSQFWDSECQIYMYLTRCFRVFRMIFVQKRPLSISSHWPIMDNSQKIVVTWVHQYQNSKICILIIVLLKSLAEISRRSFSRCSYGEHSNFFLGEVTWRNLGTWPGHLM